MLLSLLIEVRCHPCVDLWRSFAHEKSCGLWNSSHRFLQLLSVMLAPNFNGWTCEIIGWICLVCIWFWLELVCVFVCWGSVYWVFWPLCTGCWVSVYCLCVEVLCNLVSGFGLKMRMELWNYRLDLFGNETITLMSCVNCVFHIVNYLCFI